MPSISLYQYLPPPSLDTLKPVTSSNQANRLLNSPNHESYEYRLQMLDLGLYQDADGAFWVGLRDTQLPPTVRWFLYGRRVSSHIKDVQTWQALEPRHGMGQLRIRGANTSVESFISSMDRNLRKIRKAVQGASMPSSGQILAFSLIFKTMRAEVFATAPYTMDTQELFELMWDYETWQARDPQYADMPQNLAIRMHGLGAWIEHEGRFR